MESLPRNIRVLLFADGSYLCCVSGSPSVQAALQAPRTSEFELAPIFPHDRPLVALLDHPSMGEDAGPLLHAFKV